MCGGSGGEKGYRPSHGVRVQSVALRHTAHTLTVAYKVAQMLNAKTCTSHYGVTCRQTDVQCNVLLLVATHWKHLVRIPVRVSFDALEIPIQIFSESAQPSGATAHLSRRPCAGRQTIQELPLASRLELSCQERVRGSLLALSNGLERHSNIGGGHVVFSCRCENVRLDKVCKGQPLRRRLTRLQKRR